MKKNKKSSLEICSDCGGKGGFPEKGNVFYTCYKCGGKGKVDWITNILGRTSTDFSNLLNSEVVRQLAQQMANQVDKAILEEVLIHFSKGISNDWDL